MSSEILTYTLEFTQEQLQAFVKFINFGNTLSRLLFRHESFTNGIDDVMRWEKACLDVFYIHNAGLILGGLPNYSLQLTTKRVEGLRELLVMANRFQILFLQLPQKARTTKNEEFYQSFVAAQNVFCDRVKILLAEIKITESNRRDKSDCCES